MTENGPETTLVLVDDSARWALRVWRELTREIAYGCPASWLGRRDFEEITPDGRVRFVWLDPKDDPEVITKRLARYGPTNVWAIVDVHDPSQPLNGERARWTRHYRALLESGVEEKKIRVMTSYRTFLEPVHCLRNGKEEYILPLVEGKSFEALERIVGEIRQPPILADRNYQGKTCHILVTGAGFELESHDTGIGLPPTRELLSLMEIDIPEWNSNIPTSFASTNHRAFPMPIISVSEKLVKALSKASKDQDLDAYWSVLFESLRAYKLHDSTDQSYEKRRLEYSDAEYRLREAFRRVVRSYDIGHLRQTIGASTLDWDFWLTTNYTEFADRAIAETARVSRMVEWIQQPRPWLIVSNRDETARARAIRELRDAEGTYRTLLKLHGTIGQVNTMAIAGQDKELVPSSFVKPDLHSIFSFARDAIERDTENSQNVVWHVVGHGLRDKMLVDLMKRCIKSHSTCQHTVRVVSPNSSKDDPHPVKRLEDVGIDAALDIFEVTAVDYLARLDDPRISGQLRQG